MPTHSTINVLPSGESLISTFARHLLSLPVAEWAEQVVVVPTERMATHLMRELSDQVVAFRPPEIFAWNGFLQHLTKEGSQQESIILSDAAIEFYLALMLKDHPSQYLKEGSEHELKQLFMAIEDSMLGGKAFENLRQFLRSDIYKTDQHLEMLFERIDHIESFFKSVSEQQDKYLLSSQQKSINLNTLLACEHIREQKLAAKEIHFLGFTTFKPVALKLLNQLLKSSKSALWLSHPPEIMSQVNPIQEIIDLFARDHNINYLPKSSLVSPQKVKQVYSFPSPLEEICGAIKLIKSHLDLGVAPHRIALIITSESIYEPLIKLIKNSIDFPINIAIDSKINQSAIGELLHAFFTLCLEGATAPHIYSLLSNPIFRNWLQLISPDLVTLEEMQKELATFGKNQDFIQFLERTSQAGAKQMLGRVARKLHPFLSAKNSEKRPLLAWLEDLVAIFEEWQDANASIESEQKDFQTVLNALGQIKIVARMSAHGLAKNEFLQMIRNQLMKIKNRSIGFPLRGVQIISLEESRHIPFDVSVICGCVEGSFPKGLPKDYLIDDFLKTSMGLPGWAYIESLEETTYDLLCQNSKKVIYCYHETYCGQPMIRSRFIEKTLAEQASLEVQSPSSLFSSFFATKRQANPTNNLVSFDHIHSQSLDSWKKESKGLSATGLNSLWQCPYRYDMQQSQVGTHSMIEDRSALEEGYILHAILECFFSGYLGGKYLTTPFSDLSLEGDKKEQLLLRLIEITHLTKQKHDLSPSLVTHLTCFSWPKYIDFLCECFPHIADPKQQLGIHFQTHQELKFGDGGYLSKIKLGIDESIFLTGSIDLVIRDSKTVLIADYKRKNSPSQKDVNEFINNQLVFYILALICIDQPLFATDASRVSVGYWSIMDGQWHGRLLGENFKELTAMALKFKGKLSSTGNHLDRFNQQLNEFLANWHQQPVQLTPQKGKHCQTCEYQRICLVHAKKSSRSEHG